VPELGTCKENATAQWRLAAKHVFKLSRPQGPNCRYSFDVEEAISRVFRHFLRYFGQSKQKFSDERDVEYMNVTYPHALWKYGHIIQLNYNMDT